MPDNLRTVVVDGLSVSTTDQGAQAIEKLIKDRDEARSALATANTSHQTALAAKDADLAKKDAEIDTLKGKIVDGAALDKLVAARANLVTIAKAIAKDVKVGGLSMPTSRRPLSPRCWAMPPSRTSRRPTSTPASTSSPRTP